MKTTDEILAILRADMQAAKERGLRFVCYSFGRPEEKTCCAISACGEARTRFACHQSGRMGIPLPAVMAIIQGYDGLALNNNLYRSHPAHHAIGATLRAEFPPSSQ